jgi:hypothetical protein
MSLITAISWLVVYPGMLHIDNGACAKQLREAHDATWAPAGGGCRDCIEIEVNIRPPSGEAVRKVGAGRWKKTARGELASSRSLDL